MDRSLFIARVVGAGWGGGEDFRGDHLIITRFLGERKWEGWRGRVSRNLEPKRGITENFGRGGPLKFAWKMKTWWVGSRK